MIFQEGKDGETMGWKNKKKKKMGGERDERESSK